MLTYLKLNAKDGTHLKMSPANVGHWDINFQLKIRHLFNTNSIPKIKGESSGGREPEEKNRMNSNTNIYWANALEMSSALSDPFF